jgi:hypothetical protein
MADMDRFEILNSSATALEALPTEREYEGDDDAHSSEWLAGRADGYQWAQEEAERGLLHPLEVDPHDGGSMRILLPRTAHLFGGMLEGKGGPFLWGFVFGASEFWHEIKPLV